MQTQWVVVYEKNKDDFNIVQPAEINHNRIPLKYGFASIWLASTYIREHMDELMERVYEMIEDDLMTPPTS